MSWWPFDETAGTLVQDIVGTKPAVHFDSPVPAPGIVGGALRFDGDDDFVGAGDSDEWAFGSNDFTVELWAKFDVPGHGNIVHAGDIFIGNDEGPGHVNKWFFALGGGVLHFTVWNTTSPPSNEYLVRAPFSPNVGQWYHLAVTKRGTLFSIFVNGVLIGMEVSLSPISNPSVPLTIGQAESLGFMNGRLDEITIYKRALSQTELGAIFDAGSAGKCKPFEATGVTPLRGGDTGFVTVTISGQGFTPGTTVELTRNGFADIVAEAVSISDDGTTLTASFDLTGQARGSWDIVVVRPGGVGVTLDEAFTIEEGREPELWVDVIGRGAIRAGREQKFYIVYGNRGNTDAL